MVKLEKLISIDTQNPGTDYKKMTLLLTKELQRLGANVAMVGKNIVGVWGRPTLLINAHIDTVKAIGWKKNPLIANVSTNSTTGLGACDNKGNIYCICKAIEGLQAKKKVKNLLVLFSVDEEFGRVSKIQEFLPSRYAKGIKNVIVLEPTENKIVTRHPGYYSFWLTFTAEQGHSSTRKENAIVKAAKAITALHDVEFHVGKNEFNVGSIESKNISANVSAGQCKIKISIRTYETHNDSIRKIKKICQGAVLEPSFTGHPFVNDTPFITHSFITNSFTNTSFTKQAYGSVSFWSEAAIFAENGYNTILYGAGSIKQAHAPDEYVSHASLKKCIAFLQHAIGAYS